MTYVEQKLLEERIAELEKKQQLTDERIKLIEAWLKENNI